ncbi:uracil-DNA glycosylase [Anaerobacillus alkaliphilus]|uniref:Uracil-DNA glycosylase n=1 Tax=Anaerobacillus alkaliphilus TaxID=1548597 RepID=A0A4Q0VV92_9BACI|nr:uracil-DNA glycosylase [Anaerobacillus alkaliphilus]RXJ02766.1 uracil-DNA glycosylase [Anaerobacillus alkaliphilus]
MIKNDWFQLLKEEFEKPYFKQIEQILQNEAGPVYPNQEDRFNALSSTSYENTKVVILGQDPYHGPGQAHGLSFSVQKGVKVPPSLKNIYKELEADLGHPIPTHGNLQAWANQGVLLLNTVLSVREKTPNSHKGIGWEIFTDKIISLLNEREQPVVFILWGKHAAQKRTLITEPHHLILESAHPSPFSANRGFFGSQPFSVANHFLQEKGLSKIDWRIPNQYDKEK